MNIKFEIINEYNNKLTTNDLKKVINYKIFKILVNENENL